MGVGEIFFNLRNIGKTGIVSVHNIKYILLVA